jgi:hypothetical protein
VSVVRRATWSLVFAGCGSAAERPEETYAPSTVLAPNTVITALPTIEPVEPAVETASEPKDTGAQGVLDAESTLEQREAYEALRTKTIVEQAPFRKTTTQGPITLVDLAPTIGVWYLLSVEHDGVVDTFHLEDPWGTAQTLSIDAGVLAITRDGTTTFCDLWSGAPSALEAARTSKRVYAPICEGTLYVRNPALGAKTPLEWSTDFLRDHVWGGEELTNTVKGTLFLDAERRDATLDGTVDEGTVALEVGPEPAQIASMYVGGLVDTPDLGLPLDGAKFGRLEDGTVIGRAEVGAWYPITNVPGMWGSAIAPLYLDPAVIERSGDRVRTLDAAEQSALVYTIAFDLDAYELGYEVGTDHPRVGWSARLADEQKDLTLPGPDGFDNLEPLVRTGELDPSYQARFAGAFVGGFKRMHGAFREGPLAGVHYGFVEYGLELSKLQPDYATFIVWDDGQIELKTWTEDDADRLPHVRFARQNGVPVVEPDPATGLGRAHELVKDRMAGNWASSVEGDFRSVRSGACIQDTPRGRFLLYSWFSSATPSGMAHVMSGYGCTYAMLLDMNALEHTYLAIDVPDGKGDFDVKHLITGMEVLDRQRGSVAYQRFVGFADNRDFFYVLRKQP